MLMLRNITLLLTLGLFLSAATANACDGDKAACKAHKGKKTAMKDCKDAKCMKNGKCTMSKAAMKKSGCCTADAMASKVSTSATSTTTTGTTKSDAVVGKADCPAGMAGKHSCCKAKTGADKS